MTGGRRLLMRCAVFHKFGEPREVLRTGEQPVPEPGAGQARIRMVQSPIHNHDLAIVRGVYGYRPPLPAVPGTEALGVVEAAGPEVPAALIGQRVCASGVQGAWAESFLAPAAAVVPLPAAIDDDAGCQLLAMPLSASMAIEDLAVPAGGWIIQNAANGAVGRMVDTLARERGLNVVNLVRRKETLADLKAAGAERALSTDEPDWTRRVTELTGGAAVLGALDSVGGRASNDLMRVLGTGGVLMSFGALSGEPMIIDPGLLIFKETVVRGFWATRRAERTSGEDKRRMIGELLGLAATGRLPLRVETRFPLAQVTEAAVAAESPGRSGKVVLRA
jgi:NADPH:quinone reductase-like Zn-dependent oxidoreductase